MGEPPKQLKGYQKIHLAPDASENVTFTLNQRSFSIWDASHHMWTLVPGEFKVMVGSSSEDILLVGTIHNGIVEPITLI